MNKAELLTFLESATLNEPVAGAIEASVDGGTPDQRTVAAIARFIASPRLDNRDATLWALVHYCGRHDLEVEAAALLVSGIVNDDDEAMFGAISVLGIMSSSNTRAKRLIDALRLDDNVKELLQLK